MLPAPPGARAGSTPTALGPGRRCSVRALPLGFNAVTHENLQLPSDS